ncbi:MAG: hypothetical protein U0228_31840 [Myxococcaceae bacterium]
MNDKLLVRIAVVVALGVAGIASAWQYEDEFTLDQLGGRPGGGGNWSTGGKREFKVTCAMCHVSDGGFPSPITVAFAFNPALGTAPDGGRAYVPNTNYDVTLTMNGEHLGLGMANGNHNQMGVSFETAAGQYTGRLQSDTGFSKGGTCPATLTSTQFNAYDAGSTTVTFAGCNAIVGRGRGAGAGNHTVWHFKWQAPADAGTVVMYYGVVDASGDEKTFGDDVVTGQWVLEQN